MAEADVIGDDEHDLRLHAPQNAFECGRLRRKDARPPLQPFRAK